MSLMGWAGAGALAPSQEDSTYHDAETLAAELQRLTAERSGARLSVYGRSLAGRPLHVVQVAEAGPVPADERPALLVVAGLDGQHLVGTELVLHHLRALTASDRADEITRLLGEHTVYLVPRANPDGAESWFQNGAPLHGNRRKVDNDRDGTADEDGPVDLNGDGILSSMRVRRFDGDQIADPLDPRVHRPADPLADEVGEYRIYPEGLDQDEDGEIAEDGPGDVQVDRNFLHAFEEHQREAGRFPLSEPESLSLARFLFDHPAIAMVMTYGPHSNLAQQPRADDGKSEPSGSGRFQRFRGPPKGILKEDAPLYGQLGKRYQEAIESPPRGSQEDAGTFWSTAYFQLGILSLATPAWSVPLDTPAAPADSGDAAAEGGAEEGGDAATEPVAEEAPSLAPPAENARPSPSSGGKKGGGKAPETSDAVKLLRWNDGPGAGAAFVEWTEFQHPTLGAVEIGGFQEMALVNPPVDRLPGLGAEHTRFMTELLTRFAKVALIETTVEARGEGVYEVKTVVVNQGYLPTVTAMGARTRVPRPTQLELEADFGSGEVQLLLGSLRHTWRGIAGRGSERHEVEWLLKARPGAHVILKLWSQRAGSDTVRVELP